MKEHARLQRHFLVWKILVFFRKLWFVQFNLFFLPCQINLDILLSDDSMFGDLRETGSCWNILQKPKALSNRESVGCSDRSQNVETSDIEAAVLGKKSFYFVYNFSNSKELHSVGGHCGLWLCIHSSLCDCFSSSYDNYYPRVLDVLIFFCISCFSQNPEKEN